MAGWSYVKSSMRMPKKSLLRNGLSNNYRLTVTAAQVSRGPVVSLELRTKKGDSTAGRTLSRLRMLI